MHISENPTSPNTILTKCSKMTEEGHRRQHGINGNVDRNIREECPKSNYGQGGRLKFFKDGKFILELERAREGERVSWVSVPRKTFWPPPATSTTVLRQESCASLSVSDDNSSIQSSPWQRDHSWKQTTPHKNLSRQLEVYFWRPKSRWLLRVNRKLRRRPYATITEDHVVGSNGLNREVVKKEKKERRSLLAVVQSLISRNARTRETDNAAQSSVQQHTPPRSETMAAAVSPRKRLLREMEKDRAAQPEEVSSPVAVTANNAQKRSRCKSGGGVGANTSSQPVGSSSLSPPIKIGSPVRNGVEEKRPARNSSYSITSLLAEDRNMKRSPSNSPSQYPSPVPPSHYCSPSAEDRWFSESVDRLRSIELSQAEKFGYPPYPPPPHHHHPHHHHHHTAARTYPLSPYMYGGYPPPPPPAALHGYYMPGTGSYYVPSVPYHHHGGHVTPTIPPGRFDAVPTPPPQPCSPWTQVEVTSIKHEELDIKDDAITDMPLNLSKNSG